MIEQRIKAFQTVLRKAGLNGYISINGLEQRYFTGVDLMDGDAVFLFTPAKVVCVTKEMIATKLTGLKKRVQIIIVNGDLLAGAIGEATRLKLKKVAFDPNLIELTRGEQLKKGGLVQATGLAAELRGVKYKDEIALIRKACRIASEAFEEVKPEIKTGMTEDEVRVMMAIAMIKRGADSVPFNIVCFGENAADAHHTASKTRKLKNNEAVLMDFGCYYEGYCSDMTRSWWHGKKPAAEYTKIWNIVEEAKQAAARAVMAGASCFNIDAKAREVIERAGYGKNFFHSTGHGIGLEVHEQPSLRPTSVDTLAAGHVVTVEPGIYLTGKFGVRLEDSFLVTQTGSKNLTKVK